MTSHVMYTTSWNFLLDRLPRGHNWISNDEAREMYDRKTGPVVIDATTRGPSGDPEPRWVIGLKGGTPRVTFVDDTRSIWRQVDWKYIEGRWWRWITYDNEYLNSSHKWAQYEAEYMLKAVVMPDDTGRIEIAEGENGPRGSDNAPVFTMRFTNRAADSYWIDIPQFGDWAPLTDPGSSTYEVAGLSARGAEAMELFEKEGEQEMLP